MPVRGGGVESIEFEKFMAAECSSVVHGRRIPFLARWSMDLTCRLSRAWALCVDHLVYLKKKQK